VAVTAVAKRKIFARLSISAGNILQIAGIAAAGLGLQAARLTASRSLAFAEMFLSWLLLYFFCHGIAHWLVGRALGIRFRHYTIGGTANPEGWPNGLRWIFEHLPFFGVQTEKVSMQNASPTAKALMWSAGVTSSAVIPTLSVFLAWRSQVPNSGWFLIFALVWSLSTLASNWTSQTGDYAKARRVLRSSTS
jgi:hypothetical protein